MANEYSQTEITELMARPNNQYDRMSYLLGKYGFNRRHPRTGDVVISQTSDIHNPNTPWTSHNQHTNQQIKAGAYYVRDGVISGHAIHKATAQRESVWYSQGTRRK